MDEHQKFIEDTENLIDSLKAILSSNGLGNDGNDYKIIIQVFLYKFLNDKFIYETKKVDEKLKTAENWETTINSYNDNEYNLLLRKISTDSIKLNKEHFLSYLYHKQNEEKFYEIFDTTLESIATKNSDIFSVGTDESTKIPVFTKISNYIVDESKKNNVCKAIINKLSQFSFEKIFNEGYDFFSVIFEYLIKDYNTNGGGVYAEYYTPRSVAKVLADILVDGNPQRVDCYDPSAGSGTLLMALAHRIGENKCSIYSQDISQKSSTMLRLNLILNNLVLSLNNIIQGNTILNPSHRNTDGTLKKFDYIVSNPPFKLDFSDYRDQLDTPVYKPRFFAGVPSIPNKKKDSMAIYLLFIQHIMFSMNQKGKSAIVVPTGFITAQAKIEKTIREKMIESKMLKGVITMPPNIFATTGTNVSVLFLDKENREDKAIFIDASKLGEEKKINGNQRTVLSKQDEEKIINTFKNKDIIEDFSVYVSYDEIKEKNYSFSAGQYFDIKIDYIDITQEEFEEKIKNYEINLNNMFNESNNLEKDILNNLKKLKFNKDIENE